MKNLFVLGLLCFSACAHSPAPVKTIPVVEPAVAPPAQAFQSADANQITIAVVGLNDFHGNLLPKERKLGNRVIQSGGAPALASMMKILKKEMKGRVLLIDAGDEWQGTLESNQVHGATVVDFYNRLGVNVAAIGNHEFDFDIPTMTKNFSHAHYPYVASNVYEKKTHARVKWPNTYPNRILKVGGIKVGVIGVSTTNTPSTTRYEFVKHLDFVDAVAPVTEESKKLRENGANLVLVTAHAGTECENKLGLKSWSLREESGAQSKCDAEQEIYQLANQLPAGTLDGIISGHTHQIIHHWFNHIPVVQDEAYNQHFNIIYYTFDRQTKKLIPALTRIEGLIPICTQMFAGLNHCDVRRLAPGTSPALVPAMFHGQPVVADAATVAWLKPIQARTEKLRKKVVGATELPLTHSRDFEAPFENFMADVLRADGHANFGLVNSGGIRTSLDAGPITEGNLFMALPFDNMLNVISLSGKDLKLLLRIMTSGAHGLVGISGLQMTVKEFDHPAEKTDLNGDGKLEAWEANRLVDVKTADGQDLGDAHVYTVALYDYLVSGGDDLAWFMQRVPKANVDREFSGYTRDIALRAIKKAKVINTKEHPLVDPAHPRVVFVP